MHFGDDSSKSAKRAFAYGSIHFGESKKPAVKKKLETALGTYHHEIKWNEARDLKVVERFVNAVFDSGVNYRCIVVPMSQMKQAAPRKKERALLRAKLVFTHLDTFRRSYPKGSRFDVVLDEDDFDPEVQKITLNYDFWNKYGGDYDIYERIRGLSSKKCIFLQAADIITGAIAWVSNGGIDAEIQGGNYDHRHAVASLVAKRAALASTKKRGVIVAKQRSIETLGYPTVKELERGFSIWHVDLAKSKKHVLSR